MPRKKKQNETPRDPVPRPEPAIVKDEAYWHAKHEPIIQFYRGRPLPTGKMYELDVRRFMWSDDAAMAAIVKQQDLRCTDTDTTVLAVQRYVVRHLTYVEDETLGHPEYWLLPAEAWLMDRGDCEDGAFLIASLCLNAMPEPDWWRVRFVAGWVQAGAGAAQGGHGYCVYCRKQDNEWVALDWCYREDSRHPVPDKKLVKARPEYREAWFSCTHCQAYGDTKFDLCGRLREAV